MSWGMFTIGWIELQEYDKANKTFYEQLKNRQDPFNVRYVVQIYFNVTVFDS